MKIDKKGFADRLRTALQHERMDASAPELQRLLELEGVVVSKVAISNWLNGKNRPRPHHLEALAKLVNLEPHELEYRGSRAKGVRDVNATWPQHVRGRDRLAFEAYLTLPADKQQLVRELVAQLAGSAAQRR